MKRFLLVALCIFVSCIVFVSCKSKEKQSVDNSSEVNELYGLSEEDIAPLGAQFYTNELDELPEAYMIPEKVQIDSQGYAPRCMAYASALILRYLGAEISGDEIYYSVDEKTDEGGIDISVMAQWIDSQDGYDANLYMGTVDNLKDSLNKGVPVFVVGYASPDSKAWHGFVVTGYDEKKIYIADSAQYMETEDFYNVELSYEEFDKMWNVDSKLCHHLFIEVRKTSDVSSFDFSSVDSAAFETIGTKEYEKKPVGDIDLSYYTPVAVFDELIVFSHSEDLEGDYYSTIEYFIYETASKNMTSLGYKIDYYLDVAPSYVVLGDKLVFSIVELASDSTVHTAYYSIDIKEKNMQKSPINYKSLVNSALWAWDNDSYVGYNNSEFVIFNSEGQQESVLMKYAFDGTNYIENYAISNNHLYLVEIPYSEGISGTSLPYLDRSIKVFDANENLIDEVSFLLLPVVEKAKMVSLIKDVVVAGDYIFISDYNEKSAILKKTAEGYEIDANNLQAEEQYIVCLNTQSKVSRLSTDTLYFKSQVDDSYYIFDSTYGEMYDFNPEEEGLEILLIDGENVLAGKDGEVFILKLIE